MTPDELDTAIREELRSQARRTPAADPVKARVLRATDALTLESLPPRGLRAWVVPILAAAAVLVALGVTAGSQLLRLDGSHTPPVSTATANPTPTGAATPTPTPSQGTSTRGSTSRPSSSAVAQPVPADWYRGLSIAALPHTPGLCPQPGLSVGSDAAILAPRAVSMPGERAPLWLVPVTCEGLTDGSHPTPVEVFRYTPAGPRLVQTLAYQSGDRRRIVVAAISVGSGSVTLAEHGYNDHDLLCCRSLRFTQTFTWHSGADAHFVAEPQYDATPACTGDQLTVTSSPLTGKSGDQRGLLLHYANDSTDPCILAGYPGAAIVDAAGRTLADATRTARGLLGGMTAGHVPQVRLDAWVTGSAVVEWSTTQRGASRCYAGVTLLSTPPGTTATARYATLARVCDLQVHPVVFGKTGRTW